MDLSKSAMLVKSRVELKGLLGERRDQGATQHVEETYQVAERRAKVGKFLIAQNVKSVKAVRASAQAIRECTYRHTFAWLDSEMRLLPAKNYESFKRQYDAATVAHWTNIDAYIDEYPMLVEDAKHPAPRGLGCLFDPNQYPHVDRIRGMFKASLEYWPMPSSNNFVANIAAEEAALAKAEMERKMKEVITASFNDIVERCEKAVAHLVDKLSNFQEGDNVKRPQGIFRDSLVDNIADLANLIRNLNFTEDLEIERLATQLDRLRRYPPYRLRQDRDSRGFVADDGRAFLADLANMKRVDAEVGEIMEAARDYL